MTSKIQKNSICPLCNSGLRYRECCGINEPLSGTSIRYFSSEKKQPSEHDLFIKKNLGYYPDEYIQPVKVITPVHYVLIDESNLDKDYVVSGVVVCKCVLESNNEIKSELRNLVKKYGIDTIHFNEVIGRKNILSDHRNEFLDEFISIVKNMKCVPFSVHMTENEIMNELNVDSITKEQCYIFLTWRLMSNILQYLISNVGRKLILELWRESENITVEKRVLHQVNIVGLLEKFPFAEVSIYRHYIMFMKEELLFSSLADLTAYLTVGVYPKANGKNIKKLINNYYEVLRVFGSVFDDRSGMSNEYLESMLAEVYRREKAKLDFIKPAPNTT